MAAQSRAAHIVKMTESLAAIVSSSFNRGGNYNNIGKEIKLLSYYLHLMKIRYGDRFEVEIKLDERLNSLLVLKLLFQPIVENAIIHGFHGLDRQGKITINGTLLDKKSFCIIIEDNGVGLPEEIDHYQMFTADCHKNNKFNGIGLINVHQRIQLNYGTEYGLEVFSRIGIGTSVKMRLPILHSSVMAPIND